MKWWKALNMEKRTSGNTSTHDDRMIEHPFRHKLFLRDILEDEIEKREVEE